MSLERNAFVGHISRGKESFPVEFHISAGPDFRLKIEVDPLPTQTLFHIQGAMGEPGSSSESLTLAGQAADGATFFSERVEVRGAKFGTSGNEISISALTAKVTTFLPKQAPHPWMRLWLRSFKSHRNPIVQTSLGNVHVWGDHKKSSKDTVSGSITVQANGDTDLTDWRTRADGLLTFMHRGLAFAHGSRLQTPRLDFIFEDRWEAVFYEGNAFGPGLPPIHQLNQGPFIKALAARYDGNGQFPDMLWTAIGWLQNDTTFDEGRFLNSMIALEAIVEHLIPERLTTIIPKSEFAVLRDDLLTTLEGSSLSTSEREIFLGKIKGLNGRSLSQKIEALRYHYDLSTEAFNTSNIVQLIKLRNDIVHKGVAVTADFWKNILLVRELVSHIMFREVGYDGPYESYIKGYKTVNPATVTTEAAEGSE